MKLSRRKKEGVAIVDLKGKILIGDGIDILREEINDLINEKETKILLNFAAVPYLDSTGLGEVVRSYTSVKPLFIKNSAAALLLLQLEPSQ